MKISDLVALLEARLANLAQQRTTAAALGDVAGILRIDAETSETETTLASLRATLGGD
jgi:hypothetical protein